MARRYRCFRSRPRESYRPGDRCLERVEIHHHQINRFDAVRFCLLEVLLVVPDKQQASVHFRVQCLDASVKNFRRTRKFGDLADRHTLALEKRGGPTRGNNFDTHSGKFACKIDDSGFVRDGNKSANDFH